MGKFVTVKVRGLKDLNRKLNKLPIDIRKKALRPAMRKAMTPIRDKAKANAESSRDTGGLASTVRLGVSFAKSRRKKAGKNAVAIASVSAGRSRARDGATGHQALQVEFGTEHAPAQPFLRPALQGNERRVIVTFRRELGKQLAKWAAKNRATS